MVLMKTTAEILQTTPELGAIPKMKIPDGSIAMFLTVMNTLELVLLLRMVILAKLGIHSGHTHTQEHPKTIQMQILLTNTEVMLTTAEIQILQESFGATQLIQM